MTDINYIVPKINEALELIEIRIDAVKRQGINNAGLAYCLWEYSGLSVDKPRNRG